MVFLDLRAPSTRLPMTQITYQRDISPFTEKGGVSSILGYELCRIDKREINTMRRITHNRYSLPCQLYNAILSINQRRQTHSANIM